MGKFFGIPLRGKTSTVSQLEVGTRTGFRSIQDWSVRFALQSVEGVSEVASVGGFVREYQVDVDPEAMRGHGVNLAQVADAVRKSNLDVGARTLEVNGVSIWLEGAVSSRVSKTWKLPLSYLVITPRFEFEMLGTYHLALLYVVVPWMMRVLRRWVELSWHATWKNPLEVIEAVKDKLAEIKPGLPSRTLEDGTVSKVTVVPFYDRVENS